MLAKNEMNPNNNSITLDKQTKKPNFKKITISAICIILSIPLVIFPMMTVIIYEIIFGSRYETPSWMEFSIEEFEGLQMERSDFESNGIKLAGYKYYKNIHDIKGVVIISHGMGGGGQNAYMPFTDFFTSRGYYVFAYDACGNDNSEGDSVEGLPQGLIDLNNAICHAKTIEEYKELPFVLFGHSWGGYAVGNVLSIHPEIKAATIIAGFNESEDLLEYQGVKYTGTDILLPYLELYERLKFGKEYADIDAVQGMKNTDASIIVVHSSDDNTVPIEYGYDLFYSEFKNEERFEFILYEDKGHDFLFYSEDAWAYKQQLNKDYELYLSKNNLKDNEKSKNAFMIKNLDKKRYFEPNPILMQQIIEVYDSQCTK